LNTDGQDVESVMEFIQTLFEDYSKCDLTVETDRCMAIHGLITRVEVAVRSPSKYGVFEKYYLRHLLWKRASDSMKRIKYGDKHVPSWSWMAYDGGIEFICKKTEFGELTGVQKLQFDEDCGLVAKVWKFQDGMKLNKKNGYYVVLDSGNLERGWVRYDVKAENEESVDLCKERFIAVGKGAKNYYYILVTELIDEKLHEYRRAGVGHIQCDWVVIQEDEGRIV
jgi:hypothetical protein